MIDLIHFVSEGKSPIIGRYMEARRDIHPGEVYFPLILEPAWLLQHAILLFQVIFTDQPAVIGPDNNALPMCTVCWR